MNTKVTIEKTPRIFVSFVTVTISKVQKHVIQVIEKNEKINPITLLFFTKQIQPKVIDQNPLMPFKPFIKINIPVLPIDTTLAPKFVPKFENFTPQIGLQRYNRISTNPAVPQLVITLVNFFIFTKSGKRLIFIFTIGSLILLLKNKIIFTQNQKILKIQLEKLLESSNKKLRIKKPKFITKLLRKARQLAYDMVYEKGRKLLKFLQLLCFILEISLLELLELFKASGIAAISISLCLILLIIFIFEIISFFSQPITLNPFEQKSNDLFTFLKLLQQFEKIDQLYKFLLYMLTDYMKKNTNNQFASVIQILKDLLAVVKKQRMSMLVYFDKYKYFTP